MQYNVIIVAGGKGSRMGNILPKQFLPINGKPVLMHTIECFHRFNSNIKVVLVLPQDQQDYWKGLCVHHGFNIPYILASGGEARFHSVLSGLSAIGDDGLTAVHDGVRPFVSTGTIRRCFNSAESFGAAIPVMAPLESIREVVAGNSVARNRDAYRLVQTPQVFLTALLKEAYRQTYRESFTDDASVVEALGYKITLVEGNPENIKITTPFDLKIAEVILSDTKH